MSSIGYAIGLLFVNHKTSSSPFGVQEQILGTDGAGDEIAYAKSTNEMFVFIHNHILSLSVVMLVVGIMFYCTGVLSERWKRFILLEMMTAILTTFGGIALVRYASPYFSWLVVLSGISLFLSYLTVVAVTLIEMWFSTKQIPSAAPSGERSPS